MDERKMSEKKYFQNLKQVPFADSNPLPKYMMNNQNKTTYFKADSILVWLKTYSNRIQF